MELNKCSEILSDYEKRMGKVYVKKKRYTFYKNSSKNFELSGTRFICPNCGFQKETKSVIIDYDIFGGAMNFVHKCLICDCICKEEKSDISEIREYITTEWLNVAQKEGLEIIPFELINK